MVFLLMFAAGWIQAPPSLEVPEVPLNTAVTVPLTLTNAGDKAVKVREVRLTGDPGLSVAAPRRLRIAPGASAEIWVTASMADAGHIEGSVHIDSEDQALVVPVTAWTPGRSPYAANAGVLGALSDDFDGDLSALFGDQPIGAMGGLIGAGGTQIGLSELGQREVGLGGASGVSGNVGYAAEAGSPRVTVGGDPIILGALDKAVMDAVIYEDFPGLLDCYTAEPRPSMGGKVTVKFNIATDGTVSTSVLKASTLGNARVEQCVVERVGKLRFPAPKGGGIVIASYPFLFAPAE